MMGWIKRRREEREGWHPAICLMSKAVCDGEMQAMKIRDFSNATIVGFAYRGKITTHVFKKDRERLRAWELYTRWVKTSPYREVKEEGE